MKISELVLPAPDSDYLYLERYINDGSPTGFTEVHKVSDETSPFGDTDQFGLLEFQDGDLEVALLGSDNAYLRGRVNYAHPDSINSSHLNASGRSLAPSSVYVSPVAGGRTMLIRDGDVGSAYLKLTYDVSRIGRVDRQLSMQHCLSSLEVSEVLESAIDEKQLTSRTSMLRESSARVTFLRTDEGVYEWGTILRERFPYPASTTPSALIPAFSLFGADRRAPEDKPLLVQMIDSGGHEPRAYLLDLVRLIVDAYWHIVHSKGLHIECHAQNCLFEMSPDLRLQRIVLKDMDSVEKDLPLAKFLGVERDWRSFPYLCMSPDVWYYPIRASYMYDFKLGQYLLAPLIECVAKAYGFEETAIDAEIRAHVRNLHLSGLPPDYFPSDGCWYDCDNTERRPGTRRTYYAHPNPRFR